MHPSEACDWYQAPGPGFERHARPERYSARAHFESVELQSECRQRQPQIVQFLGSQVVPVIPGGCRLRFHAGNIHGRYLGMPAGRNRRGHPNDHFNQRRPTLMHFYWQPMARRAPQSD
jgi:hypothetical protein